MNRLLLNVTPNFPYPRYPLSGVFLARQLRQLQGFGWDSVTVHPQALLSRQSLGTPRSEDLGFCRVYRPTYLWGGWKIPHLLPFDESWAFERALDRCVQRAVLPVRRPDIVVCNWFYPGGPGCIRLAESLGIPILLVARGDDVRRLGAMDRRHRQELVSVLMRTDAIVTNGRGLLEELRAASPELAARAESVDFGVDTDLFRPAATAERIAARQKLGLDPAGRTLLFAGRWEIAKGSRDILAVIERVLPDFPGWDLLVAGPVEDRESAENISRRFSGRFLGLVPQDELGAVYQAADLFLLLSHKEGQPNVVKEAMASGLAVLAYAVGGIPEIVDEGVNGLVVERLAVDAAANALRRLLASAELAQDLGRAARQKIESTYGHRRRMAAFAERLGTLVDQRGRASA